MKRFGLKAVAAALALTMVASLGVPATAKAAEEKTLLIAPSPKKGTVLEVTQSMVDSEGELVLSGESFDVVVIPNDIEVDRLYLDGCVIGELSIESGNNPEVQVWDSQIKDVTVVPAELIDVNKELGKYLEMMMAQEDQEGFDINGFMNNMVAKNAALTSKAPTVVLKGADMASSTQKIENLNLKANAKLDCTEGKMPAALNVAMEGGKQDVTITVKGFDGNMNVTQANAPEGDFAILSVKAEKSNFKNVNVAATGNGNVVLRSADSKVGTVSYSSVESTAPMNGMFSLDMKADKLVTTAKTANASINLLASVEEVAIDGKAVALNIGSAADVTTATVAGQDNSIAGSGNMTDCTIADGSSASVIMPGANVAGNNTYVPIISAPVREEEDDTTGDDGETDKPSKIEITVDFEDGTRGAFSSQCGNPTLTVADGVLKVTNRANGYDGPAIDLNKYNPAGKTITMSFKAKNDSAAVCRIGATINSKDSATPYLGVGENKEAPVGEWITISHSLTVPADGTAFSIYIEADKNCDFSVDDISLIIEGEDTQEEEEKKEVTNEYSFDFEDSKPGPFYSFGNGTQPVLTAADGVLKVTDKPSSWMGAAMGPNVIVKSIELSFKVRNDMDFPIKVAATYSTKDADGNARYIGIGATKVVQPGEWAEMGGTVTEFPMATKEGSLYVQAEPAEKAYENTEYSLDDVSIKIVGFEE